ncbi:TPA: hypothetical protein EYP75_04715 [Candidatus Bathyarchaeota archaeon]|nr:hypothetical protein [Candidatus Bathyarchaeota archaeon]
MKEISVEELRLGRRKWPEEKSVENRLSRDDLIWDLAEELALEKFYIKRGGKTAEKPAFLLFQGFLGAKWALIMCGVGAVWRLRSKAKAYAKLEEIASTATVPLEIVLKTTRGLKVIAEKKEASEDD